MSLSDVPIHATVAVSDMTKATEFYEGKLGFSSGEESGDGGKTYPGGAGTKLHIFPSPHAGKSTATMAAFDAGSDFEKAVDELTSNGVTFEQYDEPMKTDEKGIATMDDVKIAWFRDPDGNTFGLSNM
jgi:catechol 2,3-dioxygenase-like lactoylglutathione lyase family enzyme